MPSVSHLFYSADLGTSANSKNVLEHLDKSLKFIYNYNINYNNIRLIISDSTSYCIKFFDEFKSINSLNNIYHVRCLAHQIHIICNNIRLSFPIVDKFFTQLNKYFIPNLVKSDFKTNTTLPIPPKIIRTCWCSFIDLTRYIYNNYLTLSNYFNLLHLKENTYLIFIRKCLADKKFKKDISVLNNYSFLSNHIKTLQNHKIPLKTSLDITSDGQKKLIDKTLLNKFNHLIISNNLFSLYNVSKNDPDYKYCLSNSIDCEKSFSHFQRTVRNRPAFKIDNLKKHLIIQLNSNKL